MTPEEAVQACEFWTVNEAETVALGSTRNPEVGIVLRGSEYEQLAFTDPGQKGWSISIPRWVKTDDPFVLSGQIENPLYTLAAAQRGKR